MALELRFTEVGRILRVEVTGQRDLTQVMTQARAVWHRVAQECQTRQLRRVLAVCWMTGRLPPLEAYQVARAPEQYNWDRKVKLAFVDLNTESFADNQFGVLVAQNRGWLVELFDNEAAAIKWLENSGGEG